MPVDYGLQAFCRFYDKMAIRSEVMGRSQHGKLSDTDMVAAPPQTFQITRGDDYVNLERIEESASLPP